MKFKEYRAWRPTYSQYITTYNDLDVGHGWDYHERHSIIGLAAEAGELLGVVQKAGRKNIPITREKVIDELGDVLWYMCYVMDSFDIDMDELTDFNKKKLDSRNAT
jgi:NTP pyrophosphatase (non-canonical NTP hydrolase)